MAQVVTEMPRGSRTTSSQYDPFFDGKVWEITLSDFPQAKSLESIRGGMKTTAERRRMKLQTRIVDDKLYVQAFPEKQSVSVSNPVSVLDTENGDTHTS
jgi:hypothetical protein